MIYQMPSPLRMPSYRKNPLYIQGKQLKKDKDYEGAAESFSELLKSM